VCITRHTCFASAGNSAGAGNKRTAGLADYDIANAGFLAVGKLDATVLWQGIAAKLG
jgi:hypothetical protein